MVGVATDPWHKGRYRFSDDRTPFFVPLFFVLRVHTVYHAIYPFARPLRIRSFVSCSLGSLSCLAPMLFSFVL
jgi:hypothetical protein